MAAPNGGNRSGSVGRALQWAQVLVALRGRGPIGVDELFVGLLLAHADAQGEVRRLLDHFGLTARDILPDEFPEVTVEALRAAASSPIAQETPTWDGSVSEVLSVAGSLAAGEARLPHVLGALLQRSTPLRQALQLGLDRYGYNVQQLADEYVRSLPQLDLGSSVPAGTQIGQWLDSSFPISPPNLASFANDAVDATLDFVNVGVEADAFAYLIASKALVPPLAIGLFGHWGSGKSFLMAKIRTRIRQLTDLAQRGGGAEVQVWGNVAHIEFNAWQYVETNLWAALLHHIFSALSPQALERLSERRRAAAGLELAEQKLQLDAKADEVARLSKAGTAQTEKVRAAELVLQSRQKEAHLDRNGLIAGKLEDKAQAQLVKTMLATSDRILGPETTEALDETRRLATAAMASPWQRTAFWTKRRIAYVGAAAILVPVAAYIVESWLGSDLAGLLAGVAALAPSVAALMRAGANFAEEQRRQLVTATAEVDEELTRKIHEAKDDVEEAQKTLAATLEALAQARKDVEEAQSTVEQLTKLREETTAASSLADFVRDRGESADYRRLLTEVSMVNRDLKDLAELTNEYNAASITQLGGPPNRIVLYIDDLDRCPPERVVDVLEAVHLLLSFELFVVVVAVDTRWLTSALHQGLSALSDAQNPQDNEATAVDYLEKIFQIPFWVDPLDESARQRLLHGLVLRSVRKPKMVKGSESGGALNVGAKEEEAVREVLSRYGSWLDPKARQLSISVDELSFLESLAPLIGNTPRRVKRFVNICHLLLSMSPPLSDDDKVLSERMGTCLMAAIHEGLPLLAQHLGSRATVPATDPATTLRQALTGLSGPVDLEGQRFEIWLKKHNAQLPAGSPHLETIALARLTSRWNMTRRLGFNAGSDQKPTGPPENKGRATRT